MRLLTKIIVAIFFVAAVSLAGAVTWVMFETGRLVDREAHASADRVVREAQALAWKELTWRGSEGRYAKYAFPDWRSSDTLRVIAPGHCVSLTWTGEPTLKTCSGSAGLGASAPEWFEVFYETLIGRPRSVKRVIILNRKPAGEVVSAPEWQATTSRVWQQFQIVFAVAAGLALSISLISAFVIGYALYPTAIIVSALKRLEAGDYSCSIPSFKSADFNLIARAVNDLKYNLVKSTQARVELTKKLFTAQEEERISLARDLHDEFGQCLTATAALASAIAIATRAHNAAVAEDAHNINIYTSRMMTCLKDCIVKLRPPEINELGLIGSLSTLITRFNSQCGGSLSYGLVVEEDMSNIDDNIAVCVYRIAQECLANSTKHCKPSWVNVTIKRLHATSFSVDAIELLIEDDGGGLPENVRSTTGHGINGIRERLATLGGDLLIDAGEAGLRILARIPLTYEFSGKLT